ncbi:MAG: hypothetical protein JWL91_936 [Sphingomonas bacterium]|nr:DciA family protein [Sphingomonas bacterium]MDB5689060.1 hypothetical protein [Sphingomonas bacterium]
MTERKSPPARKPAASERPRGGAARQLCDIVPSAGGAAFRRFGFVQSSVVTRWPEIVGARYAEVSAPESIRFPAGKRAEGVLTLMVDGAHAPMLQHVAPAIVERVNRFFGYPAVARVTIRQGAIARVAPRRTTPAPRPAPVELGDSLRAIADPELRACLEGLAGALAAAEAPPILKLEVKGRVR